MTRYPLQEAAHTSPQLLAMILTAPHCAIRPGLDTDKVLHAVTMDGLCDAYDGRETLTAACGAEGLTVVSEKMEGERPLPWPPRVAGLGPMIRCRACWVATGKKRPRSGRIPNKEESS